MELHVADQLVRIRRAELEELIDLRHVVLRDGLPRSEAIFAGDDAPTARHYGAFIGDRTVCCATLHLNEWEGEPAWQLRGMATDAIVRGRGVGHALMAFLERDVLDDAPPTGQVRLMWCNARVPALRFYESLGWQICSEEFFIPTAGPHRRMTRRL